MGKQKPTDKFIAEIETRIATIKASKDYDEKDAGIGAAILGMRQRAERAKAISRKQNGA